MGKNRKRKLQRRGDSAAVAAPITDSQYSGYDAANWSTRRGQIFWPSLDSRYEIDSYSRDEIIRKNRWLYANVGFYRAIINNGATLIGWQTPQARTHDSVWNSKAEKLFTRRAKNPVTFDAGGKFSFSTAQLMISRKKKMDGDLLTVLTTNADGTAPAVAFYESHQLRNPENAGEDWVDGVKIGKNGAHLAYGLLGADGKVKAVPASACIYSGDFDSPGHVRAISPLAAAINHAIDITEIRADTKAAIKSSALLGVVRVREATQGGTPTKTQGGMPAVIGSKTVQTSDGPVRLPTNEVWQSGASIADLGPGEKLDVLHDSRPHPNQMEFQDELIRDIAQAYGTTPEVIWKMGRHTGPGIRFMLDFTGRFIEKEQEAQVVWAERVWLYFTAWEIVHGDLGMPENGDWMDVEFIGQRDLTIDHGSVGKQQMDEVAHGFGTLKEFHGRRGRDSEDQIRERAREIALAKKVCAEEGIEYHELFPPLPGAAPSPQEQAKEPEKEPTDEEE